MTSALGYTPPTTNTTYGNATQSADGLMSSADKKKLDGISSGANNYSLPAASSSVRGGVKVGYTANGKNYPVQLSDEKMFVNVPWTDNNTTYSAFKGATASAAGGSGLVPAPAAGNQTKYLRADGTWQTPPNTTYSAVSSTANGLATPTLLSTANGALQKSGGTMTGALICQSNANYTTAQARNITMSASAPSGGSNGQIHLKNIA